MSDTFLSVEFQVEREMDGHWYPVVGAIEAESADQAVARVAWAEGLYRTRPAETPDAAPSHFRVPPWGQPIPLPHL